MRKRSLLIILIPLFLFSRGCMDDDAWYEINDLQVEYDTLLRDEIRKQSGVFILNEGNFMYDNASLSYYLVDSMKNINNVFYRTNQVPLGDVAQSMTIMDSLGYIIMNNSSKIYVINIHNFNYEGKITGLTSPRYMHVINADKAYVTDLYAGAITIIDPLEFEILGYINTRNSASEFNQHSTEQMVQWGKYLFTNCWNFDNKLLVIDTETDCVTDSIEVPLQPNSMVMDRFDNLWVMCDGGYQGNPAGHEKPALVRINPERMEISERIDFGLDELPGKLTINGTRDTLYFLNRHAWRMPLQDEHDPEIFIESPYEGSISGGYYGIGIDPWSGEVYLADAIDQVQRGSVYRYKPDGTIIDTFQTEINPGYFCFKPE